ncbi:MAG: hypothetical protein UX04_C0005G0019 [Microgenomates group bacterium GW2011_GWF2_45_18]|nr:MAG: hypothetical protein UW18_C0007G0020 [Microgenomates group bacterium GW2011_GWF1_44_10]KKU01600.1 MAG: hypothetical protein UX04_C0005G0019 [Microgenomates group bacterium GW2011_GWF2_45_18]OGJ41555.1 MAG: hypothetical protein A2378_01440 [Candidatus Pacebacteria bacterium RIFOXYB1_FULL_44_10]HAU99519.1 hypothetical protein [Candidatus Paceibacterota bacterium]HAX01330.1 hypothetical protein [Candidatus Paceibacterota bacterium]
MTLKTSASLLVIFISAFTLSACVPNFFEVKEAEPVEVQDLRTQQSETSSESAVEDVIEKELEEAKIEDDFRLLVE